MNIQAKVYDLVTQMVPKSETILEVGCGKGWLSGKLHEAGYAVTCFDRKVRCERVPGICYFEGDLSEGLPFESESVNNITFTEVFEHLKQPYTALHEFRRVLSKGGLLFMSIPNYWNIKHRLRYLLSGAIATPLALTDERIANFHQNNCGHINAMAWSTIKFALGAEGFKVLEVTSDEHYSLLGRPDYLLWYAAIQLYRMLVSKGKREKMCLNETASSHVLYRGSRIAIISRKVV